MIMEVAGQFFSALRAAFGGGPAPDEAWIDTVDELNPRETRIRKMTDRLRVAAVLHALIAIVLMLILVFASESASSFASLLAGGFDAEPDVAMLFVLVAVAGNIALLLLLAIGTLAQELWAPLLLILSMVLNIGALVLFTFLPALVTLAFLLWVGVDVIRDPGAFHPSPVTVRELRGRMRGVRAFAIISVFLTLMSSFTALLYLLQLPRVTGEAAVITGELGRQLFIGVVGIELVLVVFIVPALTAGAITGERERKTYDLLQTTLLSAASFVVGKLESAMGYIILLVLSAIPLQSVAFLFGGISEAEVILAFIGLLATGLLLGAMGLYFSAETDRTLAATVRVYTLAAASLIIPLIVSVVPFRQAYGAALAGFGVGGASPLAESVLIYADMVVSSLNPITAAYYTQRILIDHQQLAVINVTLETTGATIPVLSPWILMTVFYLALTALLLLLAVRRMRRRGV